MIRRLLRGVSKSGVLKRFAQISVRPKHFQVYNWNFLSRNYGRDFLPLEFERKFREWEDFEDEEKFSESEEKFNPPPRPNVTKSRIDILSWILAGYIYYLITERRRNQANQEISMHKFFTLYYRLGLVSRVEYNEAMNKVFVVLKDRGRGRGRERGHGSSSSGEKQPGGILGKIPLLFKRGGKNAKKGKVQPSESKYFFKVLDRKSFQKRVREEEKKWGIPLEVRSIGLFSMQRVLLRIVESTFFFGILILLMASSRNNGAARSFKNNQSEIEEFIRFNIERYPKVKTTFGDVAGLQEAKVEIMEFADYLQNPEKYEALGARIPRGALLFGPPGVGKTLLAKALAGETGVPFFSVSGSDFVEIFVGVGAARVRDLFSQAREEEKAIIFIDEIDAIGRPRGQNIQYGGGSDERQNTLNQLLLELDGFEKHENIVVFGSTNVNKNGLDDALMRAGRFDREIMIDYPTLADRKEILQLYLQKYKIDFSFEDEDILQHLAYLTSGRTGADIETIINEAGVIAVRGERKSISVEDVERAIERVTVGMENTDFILQPEEKERIAYKEAARALLHSLLIPNEEILKISILKTGLNIGYTALVPDDRKIHTYAYYKDMICTELAPRVVEEWKFSVSTLSVSELKKATQLAYMAVSKFAFDEQMGSVSFEIPGSESMTISKPYSEKTAEMVDIKSKELLDEQFARAEKLLKEEGNLLVLETIVAELLENEWISGKRFYEIVENVSKSK